MAKSTTRSSGRRSDPAEYGNSGVMTIVVNYSGTIFQKDLGECTTKIAERMTSFNPDQTWQRLDVTSPVR